MKKLALFDFDETLVKENSLSYLFKLLLGNKPLFLYLLPIFLDCRLYRGQIKVVIKQCLYKRSLNGQNPQNIYQAGRDVASKLSKIDKVIKRMFWLDEQGVEVWIITASPQSFIQGIVDEFQWPVKRVIGTLLESHNGKLTGQISEECREQEKVRRFNTVVMQDSLECIVHESYGNLPVDIPMLDLADRKFYVNNARLGRFQRKK